MTVNMSSEGDSAKNLSSESNDKSEAENTDSSQDAKDAKGDAPEENSVEKKEDESKVKETPKEEAEESDKKVENNKAPAEKAENSKSDSKPPEKKEDKAKKSEEDEDDQNSEQTEDDSEKGGDDDKEVPLLDQPLEKSGKRERKNVQRFNEEFSSDAKEVTKVDVPNGTGTALGNIPRIDASISRFKNDDMKLLHRILFKTPGKTTMIKKNIKKFNGFEFKKDSEEYTKKLSAMTKCDLKQLKSICEMLDLQKTGTKDDIGERILLFLLEPKDSGKALGGGRPKRTAAVRANNRGYSSHDNYSSDERHSAARSARDKGKRSNLKDDSSSASDEDFEPSDDGSDEKPRVTKRKRGEKKKVDSEDDEASEVDTASSEDSDFQDEPKTKRKKSLKVNNKSKGKGAKRGRKPAAATTAAKKTSPKAGKKKNKESSDEEEEEEGSEHNKDEGSSSEDEPLVKKATKSAQPPTDDEIKTYVKEILEGANLEQITMKTVCQQVYAHYPDFDLAHKKDFIKSTVKSLIST